VRQSSFFIWPPFILDPLPAVDDASDDDFGGEWQGIGSSSGIEKDAEYEGEEVLATVTVVEDFDPSTLTTGEPTPARQETSEEPSQPHRPPNPPPSHGKPHPKKQLKPKVKEKKIRYETKAADKHRRDKQHARKREKAALAGGKASRQRKSKR
jgi:ribosomal RNA-processing protein 17